MLNQKLKWLRLKAYKCWLLLALAVAATSPSLSFASNSHSVVIAHRGVHNPFDGEDFNCPTLRLFHTKYDFIEGTKASIAKAFETADVVEVDLRVTRDDQVVLFHDEDVDCKTDGHGKVRDLTYAQLKKLDLGHDLSADNGATFPFRGKGKGQWMTLEDMWAAFPNKKFMLNPKDNGIVELKILQRKLGHLNLSQGMYYWGSRAGYALLERAYPGKVQMIPTPYQQVACLAEIQNWVWFGYFPTMCHGKLLSLSPSEWQQPYYPLLVKMAKERGYRLALFAVNERADFVGNYGVADIIITSNILGVGPRYTPAR